MMYDEFFGIEESEQYAFYRVPKLLFTSEHFWNLSTDAKMLYGLLLDRMALSQKNGWVDEQGRVYIIYTVENIMESLGCGNKKAIQLLAELENKANLILRKKQGLGKPNLTLLGMSKQHLRECRKNTVIILIKIILNLMILILSFLPVFAERNPMGRMSSEDIISIFMTSFIWSI